MSDDFRAQQRERMYRRHHGCDKCAATWAERNVLGADLPPSLQSGAFPTMRYDFCSACGNIRMRKQAIARATGTDRAA